MFRLSISQTAVLGLCCLALLSSVNCWTGITFCQEKYFDNMFQDRNYIYLNVYDVSAKENRLYRWVPHSVQIDQFVSKVETGTCSRMNRACG